MNADEVMREYADAWSRGEVQAAYGFFAEDVVLHLSGRATGAGTHYGKSAAIAAIEERLACTDGTMESMEVVDRLFSDSGVALHLHEVYTRGDERLDVRKVVIYRLRDDKITGIQTFEANQYTTDEFFTPSVQDPVGSP